MSNENYWTNSFDAMFPLDTTSKKGYNGINTIQKNKNVFDDTFTSSALDYLYSNDNLGKTQSFLESNGFPSIEERQYNKQSYGAADENRQMLDLFQSKSNSVLNPTISNDTDRAFLSGLMGDEEEKAYHQNQIADADSAIKQWQSAFSGSPLESQLNVAADSAIKSINSYTLEDNNTGTIARVSKASEKEGWIENPNKRKGSENRQPTGKREKNVGHPDGEEHSRVPKGTGGQGVRRTETQENIGNALIGGAATMGAGYLMYKGLRLLPSLLPPLWWTIPGNLLIP